MAVPARVERFLKPFATLIERMGSVGLVSSGVILAAQAFLALIPLLIAVSAWLPVGAAAGVQETLRERLGISGTTDAAVGQLVNSRDELRGGLTVLGTVVLLASATSFSRALQRVYELAWRLPRLGLRGTVRGLMWLAGAIAYIALLSIAIRLAGGGTTGGVLRTIAITIGSVVLWWLTPYVLLDRRVTLRALLPGGLLTSAALLLLGAVGAVLVPRIVRNNEEQFGLIGVVFSIQSWLIVIGCVLVAAAVVAAVVAQSDDPLGRLCRGTGDVDGWRRMRSASTSSTEDT
jgi:membrane protein